nr:MAG TPA: hypothetical protein [Caudoviricetes sp.]
MPPVSSGTFQGKAARMDGRTVIRAPPAAS